MPRKGSFPRRGSVYRATLGPIQGREIALRRPVVVVSNDHMNELAATVLVMPITSGTHLYYHWIPIDPPEGGLTTPSRVVTDQIRARDKQRLGRRLGLLRPETMAKIEDTIRDHFGLPEGRALP
jgi:mRNA interferase MazF